MKDQNKLNVYETDPYVLLSQRDFLQTIIFCLTSMKVISMNDDLGTTSLDDFHLIGFDECVIAT